MRSDMRYKAVFIDWDNTLGDFNGSALAAMREIYVEEHLNIYFESCEQWIEIYSPHNIWLWEQYGQSLITKEYLSQERFEYPFRERGFEGMGEYARHIEDIFEEKATRLTCLLPYAKEITQYLAERYPLTVVTNGFPEVQYRKFRATDMERYFTHIIISEEVGAAKPNPEIFYTALKRNGLSPQDVIMIGDHYNVDIVGAQNAGIDQLFVCADTPDNNALPATYHVHNLSDIKSIL